LQVSYSPAISAGLREQAKPAPHVTGKGSPGPVHDGVLEHAGHAIGHARHVLSDELHHAGQLLSSGLSSVVHHHSIEAGLLHLSRAAGFVSFATRDGASRPGAHSADPCILPTELYGPNSALGQRYGPKSPSHTRAAGQKGAKPPEAKECRGTDVSVAVTTPPPPPPL